MQVYNKKVVGMESMERFVKLHEDKDFINFGVLKAVEEILFTDKPSEFMAFVRGNLDYDFYKNVDEMMQ